MKQTILNLKKLTGHKSDESFAKFVGVTKNTITRAKAGYKTKNDKTLKMLEWFLDRSLLYERMRFLNEFN